MAKSGPSSGFDLYNAIDGSNMESGIYLFVYEMSIWSLPDGQQTQRISHCWVAEVRVSGCLFMFFFFSWFVSLFVLASSMLFVLSAGHYKLMN